MRIYSVELLFLILRLFLADGTIVSFDLLTDVVDELANILEEGRL
jgi:hypothetical protein